MNVFGGGAAEKVHDRFSGELKIEWRDIGKNDGNEIQLVQGCNQKWNS